MKKLYLSAFAAALLTGPALAHTPPPPPPAPTIEVAPTYSSPAFDWDGFYMGLGITGLALNSGTNVGFADLIAGVNMTSGNLLFGLEGWIGGWSSTAPSTGWGGGAEARLGYLVSPEALLYMSGGGYVVSTGGQIATVGAGAEFALTRDMSLDLEYKYWWSVPTTGNSIGASLNWGF